MHTEKILEQQIANGRANARRERSTGRKFLILGSLAIAGGVWGLAQQHPSEHYPVEDAIIGGVIDLASTAAGVASLAFGAKNLWSARENERRSTLVEQELRLESTLQSPAMPPRLPEMDKQQGL
jgi:hypothetical protein